MNTVTSNNILMKMGVYRFENDMDYREFVRQVEGIPSITFKTTTKPFVYPIQIVVSKLVSPSPILE